MKAVFSLVQSWTAERESAVIHLIVCDLTALTPSSSRAAVALYVMKVQIVSV